VAADGAPGRRGQVLQKKLFANGLNLKTTGDSAIIAPPLIADRSHVDLIGDILRRTLKAL
jgi:beta-alanine--pyruvate transaminase